MYNNENKEQFVWSYSVMVITLDFESNNPGSTPGKTFEDLKYQS